jgi:hypothetical protein
MFYGILAFEPRVEHAMRVYQVWLAGVTGSLTNSYSRILPKAVSDQRIEFGGIFVQPLSKRRTRMIAGVRSWPKSLGIYFQLRQIKCIRFVARCDFSVMTVLRSRYGQSQNGFRDTSRLRITGMRDMENSHVE